MRKKGEGRGWVRQILTPMEADARSLSELTGDWATPGEALDERDRLWQQYIILVDLYKYYIEMVWKVCVWYYAITGAILVYFFSHIRDQGSEFLPFLLIFLSLASGNFAYLHWRGARHLHDMLPVFEYIAISLHLPGRPHVEFVAAFVLINCFMFAAMSAASFALLVFVEVVGTRAL